MKFGEVANLSQNNEYNLMIDEAPLKLTDIISAITFFNTWREQKHVRNFPVPLEARYFSTIFDTSEIAIIFKNRKAMIVLNISLWEEKLYNLLRAIQVPQMRWFYNSRIIPNHHLIILDQIQTMFIPTSETELSNMKNLGKFSILKRTHPDYSMQTKNSCLIEIMRKMRTESCQTQVMKLVNTLWIQLRCNQDWVATAPTSEI